MFDFILEFIVSIISRYRFIEIFRRLFTEEGKRNHKAFLLVYRIARFSVFVSTSRSLRNVHFLYDQNYMMEQTPDKTVEEDLPVYLSEERSKVTKSDEIDITEEQGALNKMVGGPLEFMRNMMPNFTAKDEAELPKVELVGYSSFCHVNANSLLVCGIMEHLKFVIDKNQNNIF